LLKKYVSKRDKVFWWKVIFVTNYKH